MASLHKSGTGIYRIRFRFGSPPDNKFQRSLDTRDDKTATSIRAGVEEAIRLLEQGRLHIPDGVEAGDFIISGGRLKAPVRPIALPTPLTLTGIFDAADATMPDGVWEVSTKNTEAIHRRHLLRHLGANFNLVGEGVAEALQRYIKLRSKEKWCGRPIQAITIHKELDTLRATWRRTPRLKALDCPVDGLVYPKGKVKGRFRTWSEIEQAIAVGGLSKLEQAELWECLFLTKPEIDEFIAFVRERAGEDWIYPFIVFVADTGARRSEVLRSRRGDFHQFSSGDVTIRERKRDKTKTETCRDVPLTTRLARVMSDWLGRHPGGSYTLSAGGSTPLGWYSATKAFRRVVADSKWEKLRGFHVFRHSFASILASVGTSQSMIDEWMGHQTEAMRRRYRHLYPDERRKALAAVNGERNGNA
jgi:integrase